MTKYRAELWLAVVLAILCAAAWIWQSPSRPLSNAETAGYLRQLETTLPMPAVEKADFLKRLKLFAENDDGKPIYMVNLMRYYDRVRPDAGVPADFKGTPQEANAFYESKVLPIALKSGSFPIFTGNVKEPNVIATNASEDNWNRIAVMRYPERRGFFKLLLDPAYAKYMPYKAGSLHVGLVPAERELLVPDFRFLAISFALILFLAFGWLRERHRRPLVRQQTD